jgi:hypothetical protein
MDNTDLIAIIGLVIFGLVFGTFTARSSNKREKIRGGQVAEICNYLACSIMSALTPTILTMVFIIHPTWQQIAGIWFHPFAQLLGVVVLMFVGANLLLIPYAVAEKPAVDAYQLAKADAGWTEKDARESGL